MGRGFGRPGGTRHPEVQCPTNQGHLLAVLEGLSGYDLFGVHVNVRSEKTGRPDLGFARKARTRYPHFLLASGHVRSPADARALFEAGADMVGAAEPTVKDADYTAGI